MNTRLSTIGIFLIIPFINLYAQFNENLEKEILALNSKYELDGIAKEESLDRLEEILPQLAKNEVRKNLVGKSWKYSHTVSSTGRKYRQSNAVYSYDFSADGKAYFLQKKEGSKTFCTWEDERSSLFEIDRFESSERKKRTRRDYLGVHFISHNRLVLTKVVKSKEFAGKSAILFIVYFR